MILTRREMMKLWRRDVEPCLGRARMLQLGVYRDFYRQRKEKEVRPNPRKLRSQKDLLYPTWLCQALDNPDAEISSLARQMLLVISQQRKSGLFSEPYQHELEIEVNLRLGYSIEQILTALIYKCEDRKPEAEAIYALAQAALRWSKAGAISYAYHHLQAPRTPREKDYGYYLALYIAVRLLAAQPAKYAFWLPALESSVCERNDEWNLIFLFHLSQNLPHARQTLCQLIGDDENATLVIFRLCKDTEETYRYLQSIQAPMVPFYCLLATHQFFGADLSKMFRQLFCDDPALFRQVYAALQERCNESLLLLAMLIHAGDEVPCSSSIEKRIQGTTLELLNCFDEWGDDHLPSMHFLEGKATDEDWEEKLYTGCFIGFGETNYWIAILSLWQEYSPLAKEILRGLLVEPIGGYTENSYFIIEQFCIGRKEWLDIPFDDSKQLLLEEFGISIRELFMTAITMQTEGLITSNDIKRYETEAWEVLWDDQLEEEQVEAWLDTILASEWSNYQEAIRLLAHPSFQIQKRMVALLETKEEIVRPLLEKALPQLQEKTLSADKLMQCWENRHKYGEALLPDADTVVQYCIDHIDPGLYAFYYDLPMTSPWAMRLKDSKSKLHPVVFQYLLYAYSKEKQWARIPACDAIVALFDQQKFQRSLKLAFDIWVQEGADQNRQHLLRPYCLYASDTQLIRLVSQILKWSQSDETHSLAEYAVRALALNGSNIAYLLLGDILLRATCLPVKRLAYAALQRKADERGMTIDGFLDACAPDMGLDSHFQRTVDYIDHTFTVTLQPDFTLRIYDCKWKREVRSLPTAFGTDDVKTAKNARKEFYEWKQILLSLYRMETERLRIALANGRTWEAEEWKAHFINNLVMRRFAVSLIWGVYEEGQLVQSFRSLFDGTLCNADGMRYTLPSKAQIQLVFPTDFTKEERMKWSDQLKAARITPPVLQFSMRKTKFLLHNFAEKYPPRYLCVLTNYGRLTDMASRHHWFKEESEESDCYTAYYYADYHLNICAKLSFDYAYSGMPSDATITLQELSFYRFNKGDIILPFPEESLIAPHKLPVRFLYSLFYMLNELLRKPYLNSIGTNSER